MKWMQLIYLSGQILDIIGAIIVFIFSAIPGVNKLPGSWMMSGNPSPKAFWRAKWYPRLSLVGLILIIFGFILQVIPTIAGMLK